MKQETDIKGLKFGTLTALELAEKRPRSKKGYYTHYWRFACSCGRTTISDKYGVTSGRTTQCRQCANEKLKTHGMHDTRMYGIWSGIIQRCTNPKIKNYNRYGGRGVTVCARWRSFENFYEDMAPTYADNLSIERVDNDGDYSPENCRWAARYDQARNYSRNVSYKGEIAIDASARLGGTKSMVAMRLKYGWSIEDAFTVPVMRRSSS